MMQPVIPWEELSRETVFQKYGRKVEKVMYRLPNGNESDYYIKAEGKSVCVVALTKENEVVLVRQYRPGPNKILMELPGGGREGDETLEQAIMRELLEETGYSGNIEFVTSIWHDAYSTSVRNCFVATGCVKVSDSTPDENEQLETVLLSLSELRTLVRSGQMTDVESAYRGLDHLGLL